jgi:hypothetical protein
MNIIVSTVTGIPVVTGKLLREASSPEKSETCPGIQTI